MDVTVRTAGVSAFTVAVGSGVKVGGKSWSHAATTRLAKATSNKRLLGPDFAHIIVPFAIGSQPANCLSSLVSGSIPVRHNFARECPGVVGGDVGPLDLGEVEADLLYRSIVPGLRASLRRRRGDDDVREQVLKILLTISFRPRSHYH